MDLLRRDRITLNTFRAQLGLANHAQLLAAGHSRDSIYLLVKKGELVRLLPRVFLHRAFPRGWKTDALAAHLHLGAGSALSHESSAFLHRLPRFGASYPIHVSVCGHPPGDPPAALRVHRGGPSLAAATVLVDVIPVTSPARVVFELAGAGDPRMEPALDDVLRRRLASLEDLLLLGNHPSYRRRRGSGRFMRALGERTSDDAESESWLETLLAQVLQRGGFAGFTRQHPIRLRNGTTIRVDMAYPGERLAIESDGYAFHMSRAQFEADRRRDLQLSLMGWRVLRFSRTQIVETPSEVVEAVSRQLGARGRAS